MKKFKDKFKKFWGEYRAVVVVVLALSGAGVPLSTGVLAVGDAVAEVETNGTDTN